MELISETSEKRQSESGMEKKYFPIFIDISAKKIVIIGGGVIATRRINTLLDFAEQIIVVAPEVTSKLQKLQEQGRITWLQREYNVEQIKDADMVIAATNQPTVNHQIKEDCRRAEKSERRRILVSVIDDKEQCDFYFPSVVQSEDVVIGINSGGTSPGKTKNIRKKIEEVLLADSIYDLEE